MKFLSKLGLRSQLLLSITVVFVFSGALGTFFIYRKYSSDRYYDQIEAVKESLANFERINEANVEVYDFHEIFRSLNQFRFHPQTVYVAITDRENRLIAERWMESSFQNSRSLLEFKGEVADLMARPSSEIQNYNGFVRIVKSIQNDHGESLGSISLFLDTGPIVSQSFHYGMLLIALLGSCLVIILFLMVMISRRITDPITRFHQHLLQNNLHPVPIFNEYEKFPSDLKALVRQYNSVLMKMHDVETRARNQAIEAALGRTITQVTHDIRSPLSSLQLAGKLLTEKLSDDRGADEVLNLLQLGSTRLEEIANDLLTHNKSEKFESAFSIHEICDRLIGEFKSQELGDGVEFVKDYHDEALYVYGDRAQLQRALGNIVKNALEAMQGRDVKRLTVNSSPSDQNDMVIICITDTGPGIPVEKISLILQGGHTEGKSDGHGIGTQIMRDVIQAHHGTVKIESVIGQGTTFIIQLPVTTDVVQKASQSFSLPWDGRSAVTVIEDVPSMRKQWEMILGALTVPVQCFESWEEYESSPTRDICGPNGTFIIDYHFDNSITDGIAICKKLKSQGAVNVVLCTAEYWKPSIQQQATALNVPLCPKPLPRVILSSAADLAFSPALQNNKSAPNVLVIDDDEGIRMCWKLQKSQFGIGDLKTFATMEECENNALTYSDFDLAFIDKHIEGSAWPIDRVIAHLKQGGVRKVWIASGDSASDLHADPLCAQADGIVAGKVPEELSKYSI